MNDRKEVKELDASSSELSQNIGKKSMKSSTVSPENNCNLPAAFAQCFGLIAHFVGYECARAASIALLSANEIGLKSEALPLTIAVGSPASALVLYLYAFSIKKNGTKFTQRVSSIFCIASFLCVISLFSSLRGNFGKVVVVCFYAYREIYCTLISTQQWSYIASVLDKSTSSYLVKFAGAVSIASAVGGCAVEQLVKIGGVLGLLIAALICTILSLLAAEISYVLNKAESSETKVKINNEGNDHSVVQSSDENENRNSKTKFETSKRSSFTKPSSSSIWVDGWEMILKNDMLQMLFAEALIHQVCANMLNLMFHDGLRFSIPDDRERATVVGRFFATVNVTACIFQCFFLPIILSQSSLPYVLILIPVVVFGMSMFAFLSPCLLSTMFVFGSLKVLEYSVMTAATEMIYMPMGQDVRYLGKELIRFFGHKLGKSAASLILSAIVGHMQPSLGTQSLWSALFTCIWGIIMYFLTGKLISQESDSPELPFKEIIRTTHQFIKRTVSKSTLFDISNNDESFDRNSATTSESGISNDGITEENEKEISSDKKISKPRINDSAANTVTSDDESDGTPPNLYHTIDSSSEGMDYTNNNYSKVWESSYQVSTQSGLRYRGKDERVFERKILPKNEILDDLKGDYSNRTTSTEKKSFTLFRVGSAFVDLSSMVPVRDDDDDNHNSFHGNY